MPERGSTIFARTGPLARALALPHYRASKMRLPPILICAYQPDVTLLGLVDRLLEAPHAWILVVDDGSGATYESIFAQLKSRARVEVVTLQGNVGKGAALKCGMHQATLRGIADSHLVCVDADGQHLPEDVLRVSRTAQAAPGALVLGSRNFSDGAPFRNWLGNQLMRILVGIICGRWLLDTQTGLRAIPIERLEEYRSLPSARFDYEMRQLLHAIRRHQRILEVPIGTVYSRGIRSHFRPIADSAMVLSQFVLALRERR